jgi:DNA-binding PadR family transcriptional regulator
MFRPHFNFHAPDWTGEFFDDRQPDPSFGGDRSRHGKHPGRGGGKGRGWNPPWGEEARTRRGDIKFILLGLLADRPRHGYELIKDLEARHGGFRRLSPGSVYPTLQLLEEGGYLTSEAIDGKKVYTVTESGTQLLNERHQQTDLGSPTGAFEGFAGQPPELIELRKTLTELNGAVAQLGRSGNVEQVNQARQLLIQVKREIYQLLASQ